MITNVQQPIDDNSLLIITEMALKTCKAYATLDESKFLALLETAEVYISHLRVRELLLSSKNVKRMKEYESLLLLLKIEHGKMTDFVLPRDPSAQLEFIDGVVELAAKALRGNDTLKAICLLRLIENANPDSLADFPTKKSRICTLMAEACLIQNQIQEALSYSTLSISLNRSSSSLIVHIKALIVTNCPDEQLAKTCNGGVSKEAYQIFHMIAEAKRYIPNNRHCLVLRLPLSALKLRFRTLTHWLRKKSKPWFCLNWR